MSTFKYTARKGGWPVTFSIGVMTFATTPGAVEEMITCADRLMYSVKYGGKGTIKYEAK